MVISHETKAHSAQLWLVSHLESSPRAFEAQGSGKREKRKKKKKLKQLQDIQRGAAALFCWLRSPSITLPSDSGARVVRSLARVSPGAQLWPGLKQLCTSRKFWIRRWDPRFKFLQSVTTRWGRAKGHLGVSASEVFSLLHSMHVTAAF